MDRTSDKEILVQTWESLSKSPALGSSVVLGLPVLTFMFLGTCRFVTELCALSFLFLLVVSKFGNSLIVNRLVWMSWLIWLLTLFSPLDIAVRRGDHLRLRMVRVIATGHSLIGVQNAVSAGLVEHVDYVIYPCSFWRPFNKSALLMTIPTKYNLQTPVVWNLMCAPTGLIEEFVRYGFSVAELNDPPAFVSKLRDHSDLVSAYIYGRLRESTRQELMKWQGPGAVPIDLQLAITKGLNSVLLGPSIWDDARFAKVTIRKETQDLLQSGQTQNHEILLNRLILEDAYPHELARKPLSRVLTRPTSKLESNFAIDATG